LSSEILVEHVSFEAFEGGQGCTSCFALGQVREVVVRSGVGDCFAGWCRVVRCTVYYYRVERVYIYRGETALKFGGDERPNRVSL
jgi:hypothetical protein